MGKCRCCVCVSVEVVCGRFVVKYTVSFLIDDIGGVIKKIRSESILSGWFEREGGNYPDFDGLVLTSSEECELVRLLHAHNA